MSVTWVLVVRAVGDMVAIGRSTEPGPVVIEGECSGHICACGWAAGPRIF
jgi:hypothetical protein